MTAITVEHVRAFIVRAPGLPIPLTLAVEQADTIVRHLQHVLTGRFGDYTTWLRDHGNTTATRQPDGRIHLAYGHGHSLLFDTDDEAAAFAKALDAELPEGGAL